MYQYVLNYMGTLGLKNIAIRLFNNLVYGFADPIFFIFRGKISKIEVFYSYQPDYLIIFRKKIHELFILHHHAD